MMAFEFVTVLSVAYDVKLIGISAKSSKHRRSRRQITRMQKCVAHLYLVQQMKLWTFIATRLGMFRAMFPNEQYTIMDDFESDETKQRLRLNLGGGRDMLASHQQQAPHVWVSRRTTRIQFWSGRVLLLRWVAAPVPCLLRMLAVFTRYSSYCQAYRHRVLTTEYLRKWLKTHQTN